MVHGRCAFECPKGESRHLQGACVALLKPGFSFAIAARAARMPDSFARYINVDDFRNRHAVVGSRHGVAYAQAKDLAWGHCSIMP